MFTIVIRMINHPQCSVFQSPKALAILAANVCSLYRMLSSTTVTKPILNSTKILYTDTDTIYYYIILLICYSSVYCILYAYGVHMTAESSGHVVTLSYVSKLPPFQDARKKPAGRKGECFCGTCSKSSKD